MKLNTKNILFIIAAGIVLAVGFYPRGLKIEKVENGNVVLLSNGAKVNLIGVTDTRQGKDELADILGMKVELQPDGSCNFDPNMLKKGMVVYAYLLLPSNAYECINATLLKKGLAGLNRETYLTDSLRAFERYASLGKGIAPDPTPEKPAKINYPDDHIVLPQFMDPGERKHTAWYEDGNLNLAMLEECCDYNSTYTKSFANQLAGRSQGNFSMQQVCEIYDYCYTKWRYVNDPKDQEYVARASESIANSLTGDCDDYAVLMASCILAVGGNASVVCAYGTEGGHAYSELDITDFNRDDVLSIIQDRFPQYPVTYLNVRDDGVRTWLNLDWQAAYPGGKYFEANKHDVYIREKGKWNWQYFNN